LYRIRCRKQHTSAEAQVQYVSEEQDRDDADASEKETAAANADTANNEYVSYPLETGADHGAYANIRNPY
jgi:hypothetical protein